MDNTTKILPDNQHFAGKSENTYAGTVVSSSSEKARIIISVDKISYLRDGWDGLDAKSVSRKIIENIKHIVDDCKNNDLTGWNIEPNINGTVLLRSENAAISLGTDKFSFYYKTREKIVGQNKLAYSPSAVIDTIRMINSQRR